MKQGSLEVICGSMFSGKTEELLRRLSRAEYAKQRVLTIKHHIDNRKNFATISSHDGQERTAVPLESCPKKIEEVLALANDEVDVVGIDEVQFFPKEIINVICKLIEKGKRVIIAGLDLTYRAEPFTITPVLLSIADHITKLRAICVKCGGEATFSQRLIDGEPAKYHDPTIMVGASECYEARCRTCFVIDVPPQPHKVVNNEI